MEIAAETLHHPTLRITFWEKVCVCVCVDDYVLNVAWLSQGAQGKYYVVQRICFVSGSARWNVLVNGINVEKVLQF